MAHGENNSSLFTGMPEDAERSIIKHVLDTIERGTGTKARGWLGPALTETDNTLDLLAEAGIEYVADWCNDEQPYTMKTRKGSIVALPYTLEIGDIPVFLQHGGSGEDFQRMIVDQFDTMYEEGGKQPRVLSIALHPFLIGHPFRARYLEQALAHIRKHDAVWITTGGAIVTGTSQRRCHKRYWVRYSGLFQSNKLPARVRKLGGDKQVRRCGTKFRRRNITGQTGLRSSFALRRSGDLRA